MGEPNVLPCEDGVKRSLIRADISRFHLAVVQQGQPYGSQGVSVRDV